MTCPDAGELGDYVSHPSHNPRRQLIEEHLETCATCRDRVLSLVRSLGSSTQALLDAMTAADPLLERGTSVGRYVVIDHLGRGGMGVVYSAYDPELDRKVALKLIRARPSSQAAESSQGRLLREAQAMARLAHPNVVHVYDVGEWNQRVFIAMELVDGETLGHWIRRRGGDWRQALALLVAAGRGLAEAHAAGLVHRDFKPDNVLVGRDGRARVTDFGLARPAGPSAPRDEDLGESPSRLHQRVTHSGALVGTPAYMAPEQMHGDPSDARADIFSFCVALYEALYGERPFNATTVAELAAQIATAQVTREPASTPVPARLRGIVLRGLCADPKQRFPTMEALLAELSVDPAARARHRLGALVGGALLVGLIAGGLILHRLDKRVCNDGSAQLAGVWDDAKVQRVRDAFLATKAPYAATTFASVRREIDRFTGAWRAMHLEACEATHVRGEQSSQLLDLRMECLDDKRRALGAMTELFSHADASVIEHAAAATAGLGGVEICADAKLLLEPIRPPQDPALKRRLERLRDRLAAARALYDASRVDDGLAVAPQLVSDARALGDQPLEAEVLLLLGQLQFKKGLPDAEPTLKQAVIAAEASRHERAAAQAWIQLVSVEDDTVVEHQAAADESVRHAEAYVKRLAANDRLRVDLSMALSTLRHDEGKWEDARRESEHAVAVARQVYGEEHPIVASALELQAKFSDAADREATIRRALAINERALGADHPQTANSYLTLGMALVGPKGSASNDQAIVAFRQAISIFEKTYGLDGAKVAFASSRLSDVLSSCDGPGDFAEAVALQRRAIAIYRAKNPTGRDVGNTLALLAAVYIVHEQYQVALDLLAEAQGILENALGKSSPFVGWMIFRARAHALHSLHRLDEAMACYQQALATKLQPLPDALVKFELAMALWDAGRERARADALARQVRPVFVKSGPPGQVWVQRIDKWLIDHQGEAQHVSRRK